MSLRGVRQLKELVIRYSDWDGSSRGVRAWMQKNLIPFAASNPDLTITALKKRNRHPCITGTYANGNKKAIGIKNLDENGVQQQINHLRNQVGRKMPEGYKHSVVSKFPSIQGEWHERMDLIGLSVQVSHK